MPRVSKCSEREIGCKEYVIVAVRIPSDRASSSYAMWIESVTGMVPIEGIHWPAKWRNGAKRIQKQFVDLRSCFDAQAGGEIKGDKWPWFGNRWYRSFVVVRLELEVRMKAIPDHAIFLIRKFRPCDHLSVHGVYIRITC